MKRHESLHPLSQHHHFALIQVWEIRRALRAPNAGRQTELTAAAGKFVRFFREKGHIHFQEEEEVLLPVYARYVPLENDKDVVRMLAEHKRIRTLVDDLEAALAAGASLTTPAEELATLLHDHVRLEENEIFPRMEKVFTAAELEALAPHLHRLHPKGECEI